MSRTAPQRPPHSGDDNFQSQLMTGQGALL
jgi:hypothetical protein